MSRGGQRQVRASRDAWHQEVVRQGERLRAEFPPRFAGVTAAYLLALLATPWPLVVAGFLIILFAEYAQAVAFRRFGVGGTRRIYALILWNSTLGMVAFTTVPALLWHDPDIWIRFAAVIYLIGALVSVATTRATHLPMGLLNGLPPALLLLWMPLSGLSGAGASRGALFALASVAVLLVYFLNALLTNHRGQARLAGALAEAEASSAAKSRFLATISHEMNTPLNTILGHSQIGRLEDAARASRDRAALIEDAALRLKMMVADALDLAAERPGEVAPRPVTSAFRAELEAGLRGARAVQARPDLETIVEVADDVPQLGRFDPLQLRRAIGHLASLLLEEPGGAEPRALRLTCRLLAGGDRAEIVLRAEPGQADPRPPPQDAPSLTLARRIAAALGGTLLVAPDRDGHVLARMTLPFVPLPPLPEPGSPAAPKVRVLAVDDIATNRFVVVQILRSLGIASVEAASGAEALQKLAETAIDLVLLDINMPGLNGEETFRAIRAAGAPWSGVPVIALTADAMAEQRDRCLAMGMTGYVPKPVDRHLLWSEIQMALAGQR